MKPSNFERALEESRKEQLRQIERTLRKWERRGYTDEEFQEAMALEARVWIERYESLVKQIS